MLAHELSTGALWEEIRMKGGAYGAFAHGDSLESCFSLATYRDPKPLRSLESFPVILKKIAKMYMGASKAKNSRLNDDLEKMIIGTYSQDTKPRANSEKGTVDFFRYLYGVDDSSRKRKLERLISINADNLADAYRALAAQKPVNPVIIASMKDAQQAAKALGVEPQILPV